jgi:hypothetical protein
VHETASTSSRVTDLVLPALTALERMQLPSGLFCWEVTEADRTPRGRSLRYSLIVLLGLLRAAQRGVEKPVDLERLQAAIGAALDDSEVTPGDLGLALLAEGRSPAGAEGHLTEKLERSLLARGGLAAREGLELAWIVTGLSATAGRRGDGEGARMLEAGLDQLLANQAPIGLFRHFGERGARRRFPNFATEIYSVLALATAARAGVDDRALGAARSCADVLLRLQDPDGAWPWLYDAERGVVVERYEVYSVHQHGMAPMTLRELSAVSLDPRYARAADAGLDWLFGRNELGASMVPLDAGMTYRSIRRRRPADRVWLYANTLASAVAGRPLRRSGGGLEINRTCRPYELGWLVEAWAGT